MQQAKIKVYFTMGSHMDLFWMGATRDCLDRGCDIINTALDLCDKHPEYCFFIETVVFTEYFINRFPEKKDLLIQYIKGGRFEIGCCYVDRYEHMYGGESIARHHIIAKRWLREHLEYDAKSTCHPDLPGLSPQIPQICALSGIDYYLRARGPSGVYNWSAMDGTNIIYCSLGYGYSKMTERMLARELKDIYPKIKSESPDLLPAYMMRGGYGDLYMANDEILSDLSRFKENYLEIDFSVASPSAVLKQYKDNGEISKDLPCISGEWPVGWASPSAMNVIAFQIDLYLENYLLTAEKLTVFSGMLGEKLFLPGRKAEWWVVLGRIKGEITPYEIQNGKELDELWKAELYGHDHNYSGFSGSKSADDRAIIKKLCLDYANEVVDFGINGIVKNISVPANVELKNIICRVTVFNQLAWERDSVVEMELSRYEALGVGNFCIVDHDSNVVPFHIENDIVRFVANKLPQCGFKVFYAVKKSDCIENKASCSWHISASYNEKYLVESERYRLEFDVQSGGIVSLYDKLLKNEIVSSKPGALFGEILAYEESGPDVLYNFTGNKNSDCFHTQKVYEASSSPVSVTVAVETSIFDSKVVKYFTIYKDLPYVDVKLNIYWWGEKNQQLRLALPFSESNFTETNYGVPFGSMTWPKMMNGVDDNVVLGVGKIMSDEIDADSRHHIRDVVKWLDVGYKNYGVAVGFKTTSVYIDKNNIEPLLFKTKVSCGDPNIWILNQGKHEIEFRIAPHENDWKKAGVYRFGWEYTNKPIINASSLDETGALPDTGFSFLDVSGDNVVVSAVKPAYDNHDAIVVRFFETNGISGKVKLNLCKPITSAYEVNLLEEELSALEIKDSEVEVPIAPHQIKTLKIKL